MSSGDDRSGLVNLVLVDVEGSTALPALLGDEASNDRASRTPGERTAGTSAVRRAGLARPDVR